MEYSSATSGLDRSLRLAFFQFAPDYLTVEQNLAHIETALEGCNVDLVVLPELCTSGYFFRNAADLERVAEPIPGGPSTRRFQALAARNGVSIVAGMAEKAVDGRIFNSAVLVSPDGTVGVYRKTHLFYREKEIFAPGDTGFRVFHVPLADGAEVRVGVMICFDWQFPEASRSLALQGADVIAHPSNLVLHSCPRTMPIRAQENGVFTVTANRTGSETVDGETLAFTGSSLICGPDGTVLTIAPASGEKLGMVTVTHELARQKRITATNDLIADRRPEFYLS